jgi:hypothetical protein
LQGDDAIVELREARRVEPQVPVLQDVARARARGRDDPQLAARRAADDELTLIRGVPIEDDGLHLDVERQRVRAVAVDRARHGAGLDEARRAVADVLCAVGVERDKPGVRVRRRGFVRPPEREDVHVLVYEPLRDCVGVARSVVERVAREIAMIPEARGRDRDSGPEAAARRDELEGAHIVSGGHEGLTLPAMSTPR